MKNLENKVKCSEYINKREAALLKRQLISSGWKKEDNPWALVYVLGNTRIGIFKSVNVFFKEKMYSVSLW